MPVRVQVRLRPRGGADAAVCEDAAKGDWYYKKDKNDCGWIGDNLEKCDQENQDGEYANDFCPETCGTC